LGSSAKYSDGFKARIKKWKKKPPKGLQKEPPVKVDKAADLPGGDATLDEIVEAVGVCSCGLSLLIKDVLKALFNLWDLVLKKVFKGETPSTYKFWQNIEKFLRYIVGDTLNGVIASCSELVFGKNNKLYKIMSYLKGKGFYIDKLFKGLIQDLILKFFFKQIGKFILKKLAIGIIPVAGWLYLAWELGFLFYQLAGEIGNVVSKLSKAVTHLFCPSNDKHDLGPLVGGVIDLVTAFFFIVGCPVENRIQNAKSGYDSLEGIYQRADTDDLGWIFKNGVMAEVSEDEFDLEFEPINMAEVVAEVSSTYREVFDADVEKDHTFGYRILNDMETYFGL